ncbi:uncharacterized protein LOC134255940 isoform X1 [Saccostrea cucullata]|uniref:uncharacterized protein LOC134255940 isoform X1 n=1 Tax=Saccostrea cuccullata TaxID=36930 RepID=UPI002ED2195D
MQRNNGYDVIIRIALSDNKIRVNKMGSFNSKVAPFPTTFRTKKQQKRLKKTLNKHGIKAKVTRGGVAFDIAITGGGEPTCRIALPLNKKLQRYEDEVALKSKMELAMIEKQERARERREEIERRRKEKMRRQTLHRQTNYKLSVMFHLLDNLQ